LVGQLGVAPSSQRFKENITPMNGASEVLLALKPVAFRYKKEIDPAGSPQFGLSAEDVEKVNPDLVVHDKQGKAYSVRYDQVNAMLLNEFRKEHKAFVEEKREVEQQQKEIDALKTELKEQRALIEKVNDKMELKASALQTAANNQ
jgi:trimeric autotransporter adhesin